MTRQSRNDPSALAGKVALVTGASSGLGRRFAEVLAEAGAAVGLTGRRVDRLQGLERELAGAGRRSFACAMDVRTSRHRRGGGKVEAALGPIDILVNNSGVSAQKRMGQYTEADYDLVMDTNVRAHSSSPRRWAADDRGQARRAHRQHRVGRRPSCRKPARCLQHVQGRAHHHDKSMAHEWARFGINVNAICPGYIETDINRDHWNTDAGRKLVEMLPRRRVGHPADLDGLLLLLAGDESEHINGAVITVDDGFVV